MRKLSIQIGNSAYEAWVGRALLGECGPAIAALLRGPRCALIADANTAPRFGAEVLASLCTAGFAPVSITIPSGEEAKSLAQAGAVCDQMTAAGLDRSSFVVALGGGVVGDLAGFVAAIYHRGIPYVQMPTTLLAQVDSGIGGKTAVNTELGKNLLGAVHQPALVIADVDTLESLPARELRQGFAEMIKHAVIADATLLPEVVQVSNLHAHQTPSGQLAPLIARNLEIKAAIVARDERDLSGARAVLNFGHTVGHAIELAAGYGALRHGEAVSLGMVAACAVSVRRAGLPEADRAQVIAALAACSLPTQLPASVPRDRILPALLADKKIERGTVRFVVSPRLGEAHLSAEVTLDDIALAIGRL